MAKAYELRGQLCATGQNLRMDSEGGGKIVFEFEEDVAAAWFAFRQAAIGMQLKFVVSAEEGETFGKKAVEE